MDNIETASLEAAPKVAQIEAWPFEFPLSAPIVVGQNTVQFLSLREPTAKDAFQFNLLTGLAPDEVPGLVSALTATPPPVIDKISAADIIKLASLLARFFSRAAA